MTLEDAARSLEKMLNALEGMSELEFDSRILKRARETAIDFVTIDELLAEYNIDKSSLSDGQAQYKREISGLARKLWSNDITPFEFADNMFSVMRKNFTLAWRDGARIMGVKEVGDEEMLRVQDFTQAQAQYLPNLIAFIQANSKASGGKFGSLDTRIAMWANRWREMWNEARLFYTGNKKLKWVMNAAKENCPDCINLNGKVYPKRTWDKYGIRPQMEELNCGGYNCGCKWVDTDDPITPGPPPALIGKSHATSVI